MPSHRLGTCCEGPPYPSGQHCESFGNAASSRKPALKLAGRQAAPSSATPQPDTLMVPTGHGTLYVLASAGPWPRAPRNALRTLAPEKSASPLAPTSHTTCSGKPSPHDPTPLPRDGDGELLSACGSREPCLSTSLGSGLPVNYNKGHTRDGSPGRWSLACPDTELGTEVLPVTPVRSAL